MIQPATADASLKAMADAGNGGGMIPEQVWDGRPPTRSPAGCGRPPGRVGPSMLSDAERRRVFLYCKEHPVAVCCGETFPDSGITFINESLGADPLQI